MPRLETDHTAFPRKYCCHLFGNFMRCRQHRASLTTAVYFYKVENGEYRQGGAILRPSANNRHCLQPEAPMVHWPEVNPSIPKTATCSLRRCLQFFRAPGRPDFQREVRTDRDWLDDDVMPAALLHHQHLCLAVTLSYWTSWANNQGPENGHPRPLPMHDSGVEKQPRLRPGPNTLR